MLYSSVNLTRKQECRNSDSSWIEKFNICISTLNLSFVKHFLRQMSQLVNCSVIIVITLLLTTLLLPHSTFILCVYFVIIFLLYSFLNSLRINQLFENRCRFDHQSKRNRIPRVGVEESCGVIIIFLALEAINQEVLETRFSVRAQTTSTRRAYVSRRGSWGFYFEKAEIIEFIFG